MVWIYHNKQLLELFLGVSLFFFCLLLYRNARLCCNMSGERELLFCILLVLHWWHYVTESGN